MFIHYCFLGLFIFRQNIMLVIKITFFFLGVGFYCWVILYTSFLVLGSSTVIKICFCYHTEDWVFDQVAQYVPFPCNFFLFLFCNNTVVQVIVVVFSSQQSQFRYQELTKSMLHDWTLKCQPCWKSSWLKCSR